MEAETGKRRAQRIQVDYFRQRDDLAGLRRRCIVVCSIAAALYAAASCLGPAGSNLSTGPVSRGHASFEERCEDCHQDRRPIGNHAATVNLPALGVDSTRSIHGVRETCQKCHAVAGHHRDSITAAGQLHEQHCVSCHSEHQGREYNLVSVKNDRCTRCHAAMADFHPSYDGRAISRFTKQDHGDFASLAQGDPGKVIFDHHQHLLPGQVDVDTRGGFTVGKLHDSDRARYALPGQVDSDRVQLNCDSCHQIEGSTNDRREGRHLAPVDYERHCVACHAINPGVATKDTLKIPHAVPWSKIRLLLAATVQGARTLGTAAGPGDDRRITALPGTGFGSSPAPSQLADAERTQLLQHVKTQCLKCHDERSIRDEVMARPSPPLIPSQWLRYGLFHHGKHQQVDCRHCHEAAYAYLSNRTSDDPPRDQTRVMIGGIDTCTGCHRDADLPTPQAIANDPLTGSDGLPTWGPDRCITCHRYHGSTSRPSMNSVRTGKRAP